MSIRYDELSECVMMRRLDRPATYDIHPDRSVRSEVQPEKA